MKIDIPLGTRGKLIEFRDSYDRNFLKKHGLTTYLLNSSFPTRLYVVTTKHGQLVANYNDTLTYLGHNKWDVRTEN